MTNATQPARAGDIVDRAHAGEVTPLELLRLISADAAPYAFGEVTVEGRLIEAADILLGALTPGGGREV